MTVARPTAADQELLRKTLVENVLPAWVKRCGARCGEIYNEVVAPITGVQFTGAEAPPRLSGHARADSSR